MAILVPRGLSNVALILHFPLPIHSFFLQSFLPLSLTIIPLSDPKSNPSLSLQRSEWPTTPKNNNTTQFDHQSWSGSRCTHSTKSRKPPPTSLNKTSTYCLSVFVNRDSAATACERHHFRCLENCSATLL